MILHSSIKSEGKDKHFPENQYWEFNPNSVYLGSIELDVLNVIESVEKYDLGLWISEDKKNCSLVFLSNNDYTAYHSVPMWRNNVKQYHHGWHSHPNHPISVINMKIFDLAKEQGLLNHFSDI